MAKDADSSGFTVIETVDICDRPIPNADPAGKGSMAYEQANYFKAPDYKSGKDDD
jgi:hypothetical protein